MAAVSPLLSTRGLSRAFGGLKAVDKVDFDLMPGEIRAVIGPNGAGKTTFVSLISGRVAADSGRITFDGEDITGLAAHQRVRRGIAYTFQITSIFPALSVFDNIALAAQGRGSSGLAQKVHATMHAVGLETRADIAAASLAYGHQRLLEVAMGIALEPKLLILDEPTQGLSDGEIEAFVALIRTLSQDTTIMLIEHNMDVVMQLAGRITVLDAGRVLAEGTPDEIRANRSVQEAYLGVPAG
jgi:branched-chain amino acid transport system ATP-binding protein